MVNFIKTPDNKLKRRIKIIYNKGKRNVRVNGYSLNVNKCSDEIKEIVNEINKGKKNHVEMIVEL